MVEMKNGDVKLDVVYGEIPVKEIVQGAEGI
jgi:hypothetical protein